MSDQSFTGALVRRAAYLVAGASLAVAAGLALRLPHLTTRSLWFDEAASWQQAKFPLSELPSRQRFDTIQPPFFVLLKAWMAIFGESTAAVRGFSLMFGSLTVVGMYLFALELYRLSRASSDDRRDGGGRRSSTNAHHFALAVGLMVATSAFQINAAIDVRMYAPGCACIAFTGWLLLRALRLGGRGGWAAYAAAAALTIYLHPFLLFSIAALFGSLMALAAQRYWRGHTGGARCLAAPSLYAALAVSVLFLPGMSMLIMQHRLVHRGFWIKPLSRSALADTVVRFVQPVGQLEGSRLFATAIVIVSLTLVCAIIVARHARAADWILLAMAFFPLVAAALASLVTPVWVPRYFSFAHLYLLALIVLAVWRLLHRSPRSRTALLAVLLGASALNAAEFWQRRQIDTRPGMRGAMEAVLAARGADEMIVAETYKHFLPAKFYAGAVAPVRLVDSLSRGRWARKFIPQDDFIDNDELESSLRRGVWFIGHGPLDRFKSSFDVPALHRVEVLESFVERYDHGAPNWPIWVFHCVADRAADAPGGVP